MAKTKLCADEREKAVGVGAGVLQDGEWPESVNTSYQVWIARIEPGMSVCMYVCMVITYSRVWINRVRLPILHVVS